jgi:membrane associated rhomboid family serine protease
MVSDAVHDFINHQDDDSSMQLLAGLAILSFPSWLPVYEFALVCVVVLSFVIARRLGGFKIGRHLRTRFVYGVPWGTVIVATFVLCVYLFVQDGLSHPAAPTVIPFRAWSYFYPTGILVSPFAHASQGHITGNLFGTFTVGVLAEYMWGHYPDDRGVDTLSSLRTNPSGRVFVFVLGTLGTGLLTGIFSLGPTIGFSGVVFAYAGFALTRYPFGTTLVLLSGRILSLVYESLRNPVLTRAGHPSFVTPWWSGIALQGHALGLFVGVLLGTYIVRRRNIRPDGFRLWAGILLFAVFESLWAVYVPLGGARFRLFKAVGAILVFLLAALLASAVRSTDRQITFGFIDRFDIEYRTASLSLTVIVLLVIASMAVPYNLFTVSGGSPGITEENSVQVRDYTIAYAEEIPNQYISQIQISVFDETTSVSASGIIVVNDQREIWWQEVSKSRLAFDRRVAIRVGGIGWRETVIAKRTTWKVVGNHSVYTVHLEHDDTRDLVFTSHPSRAQLTIADRNVTVIPGETFSLRVTRNGTTLGQATIPEPEESVSVGGITFVRMKNKVYATTNQTRVRVATYAPRSTRGRR